MKSQTALLLLLASTLHAQDDVSFRRGDSNIDGKVDIADPVATLGCLFLGEECSSCPDAADGNDDGTLDLSDAVHVLNWLFLGGRAPPAPGPIECGEDETADRLPACAYELRGCGAPTEDPTTLDALSRLHYAATAFPDREQEIEDVGDERPPERPRRDDPYEPRPGTGFAWNSSIGRRLATEGLGVFEIDHDGAAFHPSGSLENQVLTAIDTPCVEPDYFVSASDRVFGGWSAVTFQAPANAFPTAAAARAFLLQVHAEQPFFLPFTHPDIRLGHGWYYNSGGLHRACDYSRTGVEVNEDPTFLVKSAAAGTVVATDWDGNAGNYVAVESTAAGGQKVMFIYLHLRDGRTHDVGKALSSTSSADKYVKYRAFATDFPDHLSWGDDSQTIKVQVGDVVGPGTDLAWAGNTGAGGAGSGLNDDGSPENWKGNVHLHVYVAVPHPTTADTWVWVDPYGVYDKATSGCYDLLKDTEFSRLYAPFYPTFHGVPYEVFQYYFGYYWDMGLDLRTVNVHRKGQKLLVSGSFQNIPGDWKAHGYMTVGQFDDLADLYYEQGLVPRETTVAKTLSGEPRFTAIWRELEPGEHIEHRAALDDAAWSDKWDDVVVGDEWRLEDYFGYSSSGGADRQSVLLTSHEGRPFLYSGLQTSPDLDDLVDEYAAEGFYPVSVNVAELAGGRRYSGIFRDLPGCWKVYWGRTPSEYQALATSQSELGYRLWKIQGYSDSNRYAAVFHRPAGPCP